MSTNAKTLAIVGYADRLRARPGDTLNFMVSSEHPRYKVEIVRLIHGDQNKAGPGFKSETLEADAGTYEGRVQAFHHGSCIVVPNAPALRRLSSFTIQLWVFATTSEKKERALVVQGSDRKGSQYALSIGRDGKLTLRIRDAAGKTDEIRAEKSIAPFNWYFIAASYSHRSSRATLVQRVIQPDPRNELDSTVQKALKTGTLGANESDLCMAAVLQKDGSKRKCFNGKLDGVKVFSRVLSSAELEALDTASWTKTPGLVGAWDFAHDTQSSTVKDLSKNRLHGQALNFPTRAVTGHNWTGDVHDFRQAPREYNAIHFHDDDQGHAGWKVDFQYRVPPGLKSGVYAARLYAGSDEDYVPFFVIPPRGRPSAKIAFLVPTFSYMAYGNEETLVTAGTGKKLGVASGTRYPRQPQDVYIVTNRLMSVYDHHSDDSGVCYVSSLRPILNMRPKYNMPGLWEGKGAPHQFNADLHLVDWLEQKGFEYDVVTDEDLHHEGEAVIAQYNLVMTGSHPEYWSGRMLDAMQAYLNGGGRLMYMGGNGFYWVTQVNPEDPHNFEVRRWGGTGTWNAKPGEFHLSTTGEMGGLWRNRNRTPNKMLGVGFTAQGFDSNRPYTREKDSFDPRMAFIFKGIGAREVIGGFPSLVQNAGAAGFEIDRLDFSLGTPANTLLLASARGFSNSYQHVLEENTMSDDKQGGQFNELVRADIVYVPYPKGGAVFSVGSIAWYASLSYNRYDNNVSRLTENVVSRFASDRPLP